VACQDGAITEKPEAIGKVVFYETQDKSCLVEGELIIGSAMQTMLIKELKKQVPDKSDIILFDAPPGTSCPVVETVSDVDFVILVSEPTPFGLYDFKLMVELLDEIEIPYGVIVNKAGLGNNELNEYVRNKGIELLGEIPFNQKYASCYASGDLLKEIPREMATCYLQIIEKLERRIMLHEGNNYFKW
jgi:MinD superfamily P-loop ATPase